MRGEPMCIGRSAGGTAGHDRSIGGSDRGAIRLLWPGFYTGAHALPPVKRYVDEAGAKIQTGFRLFLTARAGYHLPLFRGRVFLEPSVAAKHWPIAANHPAAFQEMESNRPNSSLYEPGLHLGVKF
jgi:hypothetical protein